MKILGDGWIGGPVLLASKALHDRMSADLGETEARRLRKLTDPVGVATLGGESVIYLGEYDAPACVPWTKRAIVLVSGNVPGLAPGDATKLLTQIDPRTTSKGAWEEVGRFAIRGPVVLFDSASSALEAVKYRRAKISIALPPGDYVVETTAVTLPVNTSPTKRVEMQCRFVRLRSPDDELPTVAATSPVASARSFAASRDVITGAKKLNVAGGSSFVIIPRTHAASWKGREIDDRMRAVKVGGGMALVVSMQGGITFWPTKTGGLVVIRVGADSLAASIAAALSIPDAMWKKASAQLAVATGSEDFLIFDAQESGSDATSGRVEDGIASMRLAAGTYDVAAVWNFEATVVVGKTREETSIAALRLRRSRPVRS